MSRIFLKFNELSNSETELKNKIEALKQIISHIEEVKDEVKFKNKQSEKKNEKTFLVKTSFFTEYDEERKEENEIDFDLFFEVAEENRILFFTIKHQ